MMLKVISFSPIFGETTLCLPATFAISCAEETMKINRQKTENISFLFILLLINHFNQVKITSYLNKS